MKDAKDVLKKLLDFNSLNTQLIKNLSSILEGLGAKWRDLGDLEANFARVHIAGSSSSTMVERITNSIDATLEHHTTLNPKVLECNSPREAVSKIFNVREGYLINIPQSKRQEIAAKEGIEVFIKPQYAGFANLFFRDNGTGLSREKMPTTILSLNESNKLRKRYVMGQYGQGGSTTCAFSDYTLIISKQNSSGNNKISFTIIRFNDLKADLNAKDGKYEYLVSDDNLPICIETKDLNFPAGTLVAHINYQTGISHGFINYYSLFDQVLFDPPLSYMLYYEKWFQGSVRYLSGARRRLQEGESTQKYEEYNYKFPNNPEYGELVIRWFLLKEGKRSNEILYDNSFPILITYNGQVQGKIRKSIIKEDCSLGYLSNSLIVQIECDKISPLGRKFLFTTTRDRITDGGEKLIEGAVFTLLSEDEYLIEENEKRELNMTSQKIEKGTDEMRKKLAEMLKRLDPGKFGMMGLGAGSGMVSGKKKNSTSGKKYSSLPPLPTKEIPTFLKIINKKDPIEMYPGGTCRLILESDAPDSLLNLQSWELNLKFIRGGKIKIHSVRDFFGGRSKCILKMDENAIKGDQMKILLELKSPSGSLIQSNTREIIVILRPKINKTQKLQINAPNIQPVHEGDSYYLQNSWTEDNVSDVVKGAQVTIYVNMSNKWLKSTLENTRYAESKQTRLKGEFLLHVAFHAFLQSENFEHDETNLDDNKKDKIKKEEMDRVARTLIIAMTSSTAFEEN